MRAWGMSGWYACMILAGCSGGSPGVVYENFRAIRGESWDRDDAVMFDVEIPRGGSYAFTLYVRHTVDLRQANMSCLLSISRDSVPLVTRQADIRVADDEGYWMGEGDMIKTIAFPLPGCHVLDTAGMYHLEIRHWMKKEKLKGVRDIGIQVHGKE